MLCLKLREYSDAKIGLKPNDEKKTVLSWWKLDMAFVAHRIYGSTAYEMHLKCSPPPFQCVFLCVVSLSLSLSFFSVFTTSFQEI